MVRTFIDVVTSRLEKNGKVDKDEEKKRIGEEVKARVEEEVKKRLEEEVKKRLEGELKKRLEGELKRRVEEAMEGTKQAKAVSKELASKDKLIKVSEFGSRFYSLMRMQA